MPALSLTVWLAGGLLLVLMVRGGIRGFRRGPMRQLAGPFSLVLRAENLTDTDVVTRNQAGSIDLGTPRTLWAGVKVRIGN